MDAESCELKATCGQCTAFSFCMFIFLLSDLDSSRHWKCVKKSDVERYRNNRTIHMYTTKRQCAVIPYQTAVDPSREYSSEEQVQMNLFGNYSSFNSPSSVTGNPTVVHTRLDLLRFDLNQLEPDAPAIKVNATLVMTWNDSRLSWGGNDAVFPNISSSEKYTDTRNLKAMNFNEFMIWTPHISPQAGTNVTRLKDFEMELENETESKVDPNLIVDRKVYIDDVGRVLFHFPVAIESKCHVETFTWPLNHYLCHFGILFHPQRVQDTRNDGENENQILKSTLSSSPKDLLLVKALPSLPHRANSNDVDFLSYGEMELSSKWNILKSSTWTSQDACPGTTTNNCSEPFLVVSLEIVPKFASSGKSIIATAFLMYFVTWGALSLRPTSLIKFFLVTFDLGLTVIMIIYCNSKLPASAARQRLPLIFCLYYTTLPVVGFSLLVAALIWVFEKSGKCTWFPLFFQPLIFNQTCLKLLHLKSIEPDVIHDVTVTYHQTSRRFTISRSHKPKNSQGAEEGQSQSQSQGQSQGQVQSEGNKDEGVGTSDQIVQDANQDNEGRGNLKDGQDQNQDQDQDEGQGGNLNEGEIVAGSQGSSVGTSGESAGAPLETSIFGLRAKSQWILLVWGFERILAILYFFGVPVLLHRFIRG